MMFLLPRTLPHGKRSPDESGFTLLEIIAVIVILSIIAVVAVPRYFNLQQQAREKTVKSGLAEAVGRVNGHFAEALLGGSMPSEIDLRASVLGTNFGDFILTTAAGAGPMNAGGQSVFYIMVQGRSESGLRGMTTGMMLRRPGLSRYCRRSDGSSDTAVG